MINECFAHLNVFLPDNPVKIICSNCEKPARLVRAVKLQGPSGASVETQQILTNTQPSPQRGGRLCWWVCSLDVLSHIYLLQRVPFVPAPGDRPANPGLQAVLWAQVHTQHKGELELWSLSSTYAQAKNPKLSSKC